MTLRAQHRLSIYGISMGQYPLGRTRGREGFVRDMAKPVQSRGYIRTETQSLEWREQTGKPEIRALATK